MNKNIIAFALLLICINGAMAQEPTPVKRIMFGNFHSYNTLQLLNGSTTTSVAIASVNGFNFNRFFTGIGVGYDYYYHPSIPLFIESRYNLGKLIRVLQVFANAGANFSVREQKKNFLNKPGPYKTGRYFSAGVDYFIPIKTDALTIGFAYSSKQVIQMVDNYTWNPVINRNENIPIKEDYLLNRIAIRFGRVF